MTVTVTKPQATLRELLAGLKKRTGLFGEQLMRANTSGDFYSIIGNNRNLLINGDMRVQQRGSSFSNVSSYTADRWFVGNPSTMSASIVFETSISRYVLSMTTPTAWGSFQKIENINVRHLKATDPLTASVLCNKPQAQFAIGTTSSSSTNYPTTGVPELGGYYRHTVTIQLTPTQISEIAGGAHVYFEVNPYNYTGDFRFTEAQFEVSPVRTPFEQRQFGQELTLCQRYYYADAVYMQAYQLSGQDYTVLIKHPTTMRASPTLTFATAAISVNVSSFQVAVVPAVNDTTKGFRPYVRATASGLVEYNATYTANAEL